MIDDLGMDLLMNGIGELKFPATRCVQCGEVLDPVILQNRQLRQPSMPNGCWKNDLGQWHDVR
jgi:hypothetical protein